MHLNGTDGEIMRQNCNCGRFKFLLSHKLLCFPAELVAAVRFFNQRQAQVQQQTQDQSEETRERLDFLELQAQVGWSVLLYSTWPHLSGFRQLSMQAFYKIQLL